VVVGRHVVGRLEHELGVLQGRLDIAARTACRHQTAEEHLRLVGGVAPLGDRRDRWAPLVADSDVPRAVLGLVVAVGDNDRDRLTVVVNFRVLEREEALAWRRTAHKRGKKVRLARDLRQVLMREDCDDGVRGKGRAAVDRSDRPARNGRTDDRGIGEARREDLARVPGAPHRLLVPVET
jgi:hypothetical protein